MSQLTVELDEGAKIVRMKAQAGIGSWARSDAIVRQVEKRPELADWDWICDLREPIGEGAGDDLDRLPILFERHATRKTFTVLISLSPDMPRWAGILNEKFRRRTHLVAATPQEAEAMLAGVRS